MSARTISACRVCESKNLQEILSLGNSYLSNFRTDKKKPKKFPLDLVLCPTCKLVQLRHNAPQSLLYTENYGYRSGINQTMKTELQEITQEALRMLNKKTPHLFVVDIGANDGTLLSFYPKTVERIGVEPIKKLASLCKKQANVVINDFFNYKNFTKKLRDKKADIITIISCFYDMEEPNEFIADVKKILNEKGIIVIQQNYLVSMLRQNAFDNIVHEHLEYYSLLSLSYLLNHHNLEVFHVKESKLNGGSFRTYIARIGERKISSSVTKMLQEV